MVRTVIGKRSVYYHALRVPRRTSETDEELEPIVEETTEPAAATVSTTPTVTNGARSGARPLNGSPSA